MTLAHVWFCLQLLVRQQKGRCESEPHQTKQKHNNVVFGPELADFPGVNAPLHLDQFRLGVGDMTKISYHDFFRNIPISQFDHDFFVMLVLLFCLSSAAKIISLL